MLPRCTCSLHVYVYNPTFVCNRITDMLNMGLVDRWIKQHWPKSDACASGSEADARQATIGDVQGAFVVFSAGLTVASVAFFTENVMHKILSTSISRRVRTMYKTPTEIFQQCAWFVGKRQTNKSKYYKYEG